jgi:hypothetical protein
MGNDNSFKFSLGRAGELTGLEANFILPALFTSQPDFQFSLNLFAKFEGADANASYPGGL